MPGYNLSRQVDPESLSDENDDDEVAAYLRGLSGKQAPQKLRAEIAPASRRLPSESSQNIHSSAALKQLPALTAAVHPIKRRSPATPTDFDAFMASALSSDTDTSPSPAQKRPSGDWNPPGSRSGSRAPGVSARLQTPPAFSPFSEPENSPEASLSISRNEEADTDGSYTEIVSDDGTSTLGEMANVHAGIEELCLSSDLVSDEAEVNRSNKHILDTSLHSDLHGIDSAPDSASEVDRTELGAGSDVTDTCGYSDDFESESQSEAQTTSSLPKVKARYRADTLKGKRQPSSVTPPKPLASDSSSGHAARVATNRQPEVSLSDRLGPMPIGRLAVDPDALEVLAQYDPSVLITTDLLRQQLNFTRTYVETSRRMTSLLVEPSRYNKSSYTTLKETQKYMKGHGSPPVISMEEAMRQVEAEEPRLFA